jgi:hypothetical protein
MPHPADHPLAAAAILRGLSNQLQKAKAAGDEATAAAIQAAFHRAQIVVKRAAAHQHVPGYAPPRPPLPEREEGWVEIVSDRRQRRRF